MSPDNTENATHEGTISLSDEEGLKAVLESTVRRSTNATA